MTRRHSLAGCFSQGVLRFVEFSNGSEVIQPGASEILFRQDILQDNAHGKFLALLGQAQSGFGGNERAMNRGKLIAQGLPMRESLDDLADNDGPATSVRDPAQP